MEEREYAIFTAREDDGIAEEEYRCGCNPKLISREPEEAVKVDSLSRLHHA